MIENNEHDLLLTELVNELSEGHDYADNRYIIDAIIEFESATQEELEYEEIHGNVGETLLKLTQASDSELSIQTKVAIF